MKITINGLDNSGKTIQSDLLNFSLSSFYLSPPLDFFEKKWKEVSKNNFSEWWFVKSTTEELTSLLQYSSEKRYENTLSHTFTIVDRGSIMLKNVCIATSCIKDRISLSEAKEKIKTIFNWDNYICSLESINIILLYDNHIDNSVTNLLKRDNHPFNHRYELYQKHLYELLLNDCTDKNLYDCVIYTKNKSIIDIQNEIRKYLNSCHNFNIDYMFNNINSIWGLAGLSESGKSFSGEYLRLNHGFDRKKISYFMFNAQNKLNIDDIYSVKEESLSLILIKEMDSYCKFHHYIYYLCIESLHGYILTKKLKDFLGNKFKIIYFSTPLELRALRNSSSILEVQQKDLIKKNRGAHKIEQISDIVYDNSKSKFTLISFIEKHSQNNFYPPKACNVLNLKFGNNSLREKIRDFLDNSNKDEIYLVCITGSGYTQFWKEGWSDIDVLIVISGTKALSWCKSFYEIFECTTYKAGFTIYTKEEFLSIHTKNSVKHFKHMLESGDLQPIFISKKFTTTRVIKDLHINDILQDIITVLSTLRRLLISEPNNIRQIYKHIILLLKLHLKLEDVHIEGDNEIIKNYTKRMMNLEEIVNIELPEMESLIKKELKAVSILNSSALSLLSYFENLSKENRCSTKLEKD